MTLPTPIPTSPARSSSTAPRPGRLARLKLTEPVLLYVYGAALLWLLASSVAAAVTGAWLSWGSAAVGVLLTSSVGGWAARASAYSPRSTIAAVMRARSE